MNKKEFNDIFKKNRKFNSKTKKNKIIRELAGNYLNNLKDSFEKQLNRLERDLTFDINFYFRHTR